MTTYVPPTMTGFQPTHVTVDGGLVSILPDQEDRKDSFLHVIGRRGGITGYHQDQLFALGTPEAEEILEGLGLRTEASGQEDDANRVTLANWSRTLEQALMALRKGVGDTLAMSGTDGLGWRGRERLEKALLEHAAKLAEFRP